MFKWFCWRKRWLEKQQLQIETDATERRQLIERVVNSQPLNTLLGQNVDELEQLFDVDQDDPELWKQLYQRNLYFKLAETEKSSLDRIQALVLSLRNELQGVEYQSVDMVFEAIKRYISIVVHQQAQLMPKNPMEM